MIKFNGLVKLIKAWQKIPVSCVKKTLLLMTVYSLFNIKLKSDTGGEGAETHL